MDPLDGHGVSVSVSVLTFPPSTDERRRVFQKSVDGDEANVNDVPLSFYHPCDDPVRCHAWGSDSALAARRKRSVPTARISGRELYPRGLDGGAAGSAVA